MKLGKGEGRGRRKGRENLNIVWKVEKRERFLARNSIPFAKMVPMILRAKKNEINKRKKINNQQ